MSLIKWKTTGWSTEIQKIEIARETDSSIFLASRHGERREAKRTGYHIYHDSWEDARTHLMEAEAKKELHARASLDKALKNIGILSSMAEPK